MTLSLPDELSAEQILESLPADVEAADTRTAEGRAWARTRARGLIHLIARELWQSVQRGHRGRRAADVQDYYEGVYEGDPLAVAQSYVATGRPTLFRIGRDRMAKLRGFHVSRLATRRMGDLIAALEPRDLTEVGCGHGRNLLYFANRFPGLPCTGFELSASGVEMAQALQRLDLPNTAYGRTYELAAPGMANVRRIAFRQASAFDLPAASGSADVVVTFQALEQMHDGLDKALAEIRRITGRYALFYEPFADFNDALGRAYLWSRNYFRLPTAHLKRNGFEVVKLWRDMPVKPTFAYGFVLCRPR